VSFPKRKPEVKGAFENRVLSRMDLKREEVQKTGENCIMRSHIINALQNESRRIRWA
jgi:hypothetical protein